MTDLITVTIQEKDFTFDRFRSVNPIESFADYMVSNLLPVLETHMPELVTTHCLLSGFPVAKLLPIEIEQMIRQGVLALQLDEFDGVLMNLDEDSNIDAFELLVDHVQTRIIESSKPAPSMSFSNNRLAMAHQPWQRQLSSLLSLLLFDTGMFRNKRMAMDDRFARIMATIELAKAVQAIETSQLIDDLHAALIELDAKYSIRSLVFIRRETETLEALRTAEVIDFEAILTFVLKLISYRDKNQEIVEEGVTLWTKEVFAARTFNAIDRAEFSNIFKPEPIHVPGSTNPVGRPKGPVDPVKADKAKAKKIQQDVFLDAFNAIFGQKI
jgi:hypothetical protein